MFLTGVDSNQTDRAHVSQFTILMHFRDKAVRVRFLEDPVLPLIVISEQNYCV